MTDQATQITDRQFHDEIIELCKGTHWTQGELKTFCWVAVTEESPAPEGSITKVDRGRWDSEKGEYVGSLVWRKAQWCLVGMVFKVGGLYTNNPEFATEDDFEKQFVDDEKFALQADTSEHSEAVVARKLFDPDDDSVQVVRILKQLYDQLPEDFKTKFDNDDVNPVMTGSHWDPGSGHYDEIFLEGDQARFLVAIKDVERWNDYGRNGVGDGLKHRTRDEVIALIAAARDSLPEEAPLEG